MKNSILLLFLFFLLSACTPEPASDRAPLHIVVTTSFIKDGIKEIVGDSAEVTALIGPAADPSMYEATTEDLDLMKNADVIICNGLNLEMKLGTILEDFSKQKPVLKISDGVDSKKLIQHKGITDPNICLDLELWMQGMEQTARELGKIDSLSAAYFLANYKMLNDSAMRVDRSIAEQIDSVVKGKPLVTTSAKYAYFFRHYNLTGYSVHDNFTTVSGGQNQPQDLVDFIIQNQIPVIYTDASSDSDEADSIIALCALRSHSLFMSGPLYADAAGEPDTRAGSHFGMLFSNLAALTGTAVAE